MILFVLAFLSLSNASVPELWINLDEPLEQRYSEIIPLFKTGIQQYAHEWSQMMKFTQDDLTFFDELSEFHHDQELVQDTKIVAKLADVPFNLLYSMQFMYDLGTTLWQEIFGCTSIIVRTEKPYIARNLDYGFRKVIQALTVKSHFYRGDKNYIIATTMGIVGQLVVTHSIQSQYAAITINQLNSHFTRKQQYEVLKSNQYDSVIRFVFKLSLHAKSYQEIMESLLSVRVNAHSYAIVVGSNSEEYGVVHVFDWFEKNNSDEPHLRIDNESKFLVTTNGITFDVSDSRIRNQKAVERMSQLSEDELKDPQVVIEKVLSKYPNNNYSTIGTAVLSTQNEMFIMLYE